MAQLVKQSLCELEDQRSVPSTHIESSVWRYTAVTPAVGRSSLGLPDPLV